MRMRLGKVSFHRPRKTGQGNDDNNKHNDRLLLPLLLPLLYMYIYIYIEREKYYYTHYCIGSAAAQEDRATGPS